jgi:hypothetical protein
MLQFSSSMSYLHLYICYRGMQIKTLHWFRKHFHSVVSFVFFIRYVKNDQYNAAFEEDTQTKH